MTKAQVRAMQVALKKAGDAITALSAAPSGCAEAGEISEKTLTSIARSIARDCYGECQNFAPGMSIECREEMVPNIINALRDVAQLARPSPSPAGGADGERLDWLERNPFTLYRNRDCDTGKMPDYCVLVDEDRHENGLGRTGILKPTARACIDAARAATQATPAKEGK